MRFIDHSNSKGSLSNFVDNEKDVSCTMPFPCWLLGKLALDKKYQGQKLGEKLLMAACDHAARLSNDNAGGFCVIVDANDQNAKNFYLNYGFIAFKDESAE